MYLRACNTELDRNLRAWLIDITLMRADNVVLRKRPRVADRLLEKSIGTILRHAIFKTSRRLRRARPSNEINESNDSYVESIHVSADAGEWFMTSRWQSNSPILAKHFCRMKSGRQWCE